VLQGQAGAVTLLFYATDGSVKVGSELCSFTASVAAVGSTPPTTVVPTTVVPTTFSTHRFEHRHLAGRWSNGPGIRWSPLRFGSSTLDQVTTPWLTELEKDEGKPPPIGGGFPLFLPGVVTGINCDNWLLHWIVSSKSSEVLLAGVGTKDIRGCAGSE